MATRTVASRKSRFDHLSFLQKVNECPFLYDINDANYKDMVLKEARWTEIGAGFNMTGQVAQLKWKSLRDRFTREKKKYEDLRKNTEDEVPLPKWWLFVIIGKMLDRAHDLPLLLMNGDGYEGNGAGNDSYEPAGSMHSFADDRSSFPNNYRHNNNNNSKNHHHLRNHRHSNNNNNHGETSRSSICSGDLNETDMANPVDGSIAGTSAVEISSAVHCEVSIEDDDDDDDSHAPNATSTNQFQHQHNNSQSCSSRKRARVEDTMSNWTYQLSNCLLQRIVDIYPPNSHGINGANQSGDTFPMDDVDYYVRSLGPRLRRLKAKDRGLVRLKIETALYDIESAVDE